MKLRRPTRLIWRFYWVGILQLALVAGAVLLLGDWLSRFSNRWDMQGLITRLTPLAAFEERLQTELSRLRSEQGLLISVYDLDGRVVATNRTPPLRPPPWTLRLPLQGPGHPKGPLPEPGHYPPPFVMDDLRRPPLPLPPGPPPFGVPGDLPPGPPPSETYSRIPLAHGDGILVARLEQPRSRWALPAATLLFGSLVVAVGALLTARTIGRPLEHLAHAVRSFGQGDLRARTETSRPDELGDVLRTFDEMADRIQRLVAAEKELLANVAHELRTPLARIRVALEIAAEADNEQARASLAEVAQDLSELETLVDDVLRTARVELVDGNATPARLPLNIELIGPATLSNRSAELFRTRHPSRTLVLEIAENLPEVEVDPVLFRRVLDNLLDNAHKYSPEPERPVTLRVSAAAERVTFEVSDRGQGISEQDLSRIFSAFFRGERSRSRRAGGVGLGLTLVQRIVEAHGGNVDVKSERSVGTRVLVTVPSANVA